MSNYYRFIPFDSSRNTFSSVSTDDVLSTTYGDYFIQNYPLTSSISTFFYSNKTEISASVYTEKDPDRLYIKSLKSIFKKYEKYSFMFSYSSSYADFETDSVTLVNIPNIFYGQSLEKGSVKLSIYTDGVLLCQVQDVGRNGELIQTTGSAVLNDKKTAGLVFYDEGIILLHASAALDTYTEEFYSTPDNPLSGAADYPRWNTWGISLNALNGSVTRTSYDIEFNGVNSIPQLTLLAHANSGEINNSNNKTFLDKDDETTLFSSGPTAVLENQQKQIKNITKTPYLSPEPAFHKETYISKILIYDKDKNVIGIAKLATPVRKTEDRSYTFKLKLNL
jgi:hypothetical protein